MVEVWLLMWCVGGDACGVAKLDTYEQCRTVMSTFSEWKRPGMLKIKCESTAVKNEDRVPVGKADKSIRD